MGENPYHHPIGKNIYYKYQATSIGKRYAEHSPPKAVNLFFLQERIDLSIGAATGEPPPILFATCFFCRGAQHPEPADRPCSGSSVGCFLFLQKSSTSRANGPAERFQHAPAQFRLKKARERENEKEREKEKEKEKKEEKEKEEKEEEEKMEKAVLKVLL